MSGTAWETNHPADDFSQGSSRMFKSAALALLIETVTVIACGWQKHWLVHPGANKKEETNSFIEAEIFHPPPKAYLTAERKAGVLKQKTHQTTLNKPPDKRGPPQPNPSSLPEETNQTQEGKTPFTHSGPIAIFAPPPPVIPESLRDRDLKTSVLIEFRVDRQGVSSAQIVTSSGVKELDASALESARKWQFKPAERDGKPVDSKFRLRFKFQVE